MSENERNFLEIQCGKEKSNLWDGRYQLSDGRKGKKKREKLFHLCIAAIKQIKVATSGKDH